MGENLGDFGRAQEFSLKETLGDFTFALLSE